MALITCNNCGHPVSDRAETCPHCGATIGNAVFKDSSGGMNKSRLVPAVIGLVVLAVVGGGALLYYFLNNPIDKVKTFAIDFAAKVTQNQVASVHELYPQSEICESFVSLRLNPDNIQVTETSVPNHYLVCCGDGVDFKVSKADDGTMSVTESHGLFAFPDADMDLAKQTGQWKASLTDVENAQRMANRGFADYLKMKSKDDILSKVKIVKNTKSFGECLGAYDVGAHYWKHWRTTHTVIVENKTNKDFPAEAYSLKIPDCDDDVEIDLYNKNATKVDGKLIPPHGSVTIMWTDVHSDGTRNYDDIVTLDFNPNKFPNVINATGYEFDEYIGQLKAAAASAVASVDLREGVLTDPQAIDSFVNVRSGPGMNYGIVAQLDVGTTVNFCAGSGKWLKVYDTNGSYLGYVFKNCVRVL